MAPSHRLSGRRICLRIVRHLHRHRALVASVGRSTGGGSPAPDLQPDCTRSVWRRAGPRANPAVPGGPCRCQHPPPDRSLEAILPGRCVSRVATGDRSYAAVGRAFDLHDGANPALCSVIPLPGPRGGCHVALQSVFLPHRAQGCAAVVANSGRSCFDSMIPKGDETPGLENPNSFVFCSRSAEMTS